MTHSPVFALRYAVDGARKTIITLGQRWRGNSSDVSEYYYLKNK
jgi:hypothetical protein